MLVEILWVEWGWISLACLRRQRKTSKIIYPMRKKHLCTKSKREQWSHDRYRHHAFEISDTLTGSNHPMWVYVVTPFRFPFPQISYQGYPPPTTFLQRTSSQITTSTSLHTYSTCPHVDTTQTSSLTLSPKKGRGRRLQPCPRLPRRRLLCPFQKHVCAHERFSWLSARPLRIEDRDRANPAQGRMASTWRR